MNRAASTKFANRRLEDQLEVIRSLFRTDCFAPPDDTQPKTPVQMMPSARRLAEKIPPTSWSAYGEVQFNNDCFFPLNNPVDARSSPRRSSRLESQNSVDDVITDDEPPGPPPTLGNMPEEISKWVLSSEGQGVPQKTDEPNDPPPPLCFRATLECAS